MPTILVIQAYSAIETYARLLMTAPLFVAGAILTVLVVITAIKWFCHWATQRAARKEMLLSRMGPDGQPYPPSGRGLCDACQKSSDKVYYMPSGQRLCVKCYGKLPSRHVQPRLDTETETEDSTNATT